MLCLQFVSGGPVIRAEYAIIETNCTTADIENCIPLESANAHHGFCHARGYGLDVEVDCEIFQPDNVTLPVLPAGPGSSSTSQGFKNHKLTTLHDPDATGLLSESGESAEKAPIVKRTAVDIQANAVLSTEPVVLLPRCPGKTIHF